MKEIREGCSSRTLTSETDAYQKRPRGQLDTDSTGITQLAQQPDAGDDNTGDDRLDAALKKVLEALPDNFRERFTKLEAAHRYHANALSALSIEIRSLADRESRLDEKFTQFETERWFAKTIDHTGYRPEPTQWEPASVTSGREWRRTSPYRR